MLLEAEIDSIFVFDCDCERYLWTEGNMIEGMMECESSASSLPKAGLLLARIPLFPKWVIARSDRWRGEIKGAGMRWSAREGLSTFPTCLEKGQLSTPHLQS
jgi:hypothetical protein